MVLGLNIFLKISQNPCLKGTGIQNLLVFITYLLLLLFYFLILNFLADKCVNVNIDKGAVNVCITVESNSSIWCSVDRFYCNLFGHKLLILIVVPSLGRPIRQKEGQT